MSTSFLAPWSRALPGLLLAACSGAALGQNILVEPGAGSYPTLAAAFAAINAGTHTGAVVVEVVGDTSEIAVAQLNASGAGGASYTSVLLRPAGGATRTISSAQDRTLLLDGADQVTIDGLDTDGNALVLRNTATASSGTLVFQNGATHNTITRTTLTGRQNGNAVVVFGGDQTGGDGNDHNTLSGNRIGAADATLPVRGILCQGSTGSATAANQFGTLSDNQIADIFAASGASVAISFQSGCNQWTLSGNLIFQSAPRTFTQAGSWRAIELQGNDGNAPYGMLVTGNRIGHATADGSGTAEFGGSSNRLVGIYSRVPANLAANRIEGNQVHAIRQTTEQTGTGVNGVFAGILIESGQAEVIDNQIGASAAAPDLWVHSSGAAATDVAAIASFGTTSVVVIQGNQIGGLRHVHATATAGSAQINLFGIRSGNCARCLVSHNSVGGTTPASLQLSSNSTRVTTFGIQLVGADLNASSNTVRHLETIGGDPATVQNQVVGLQFTGLGNSHALASGNLIHGLYAASGTVQSRVVGLLLAVGGASATHNRIHHIAMAEQAGSGEVIGLQLASSGLTARNNMISLGKDVLGAPLGYGIRLIGIRENGFDTRVQHNSVLVFGAPSAGDQITAAFDSLQGSPSRFFQHNIFANQRSNTGGTGRHYALRFDSARISTTNAAFISNFNALHAPGTGGRIADFLGTDLPTLGAWQAFSGQDAQSVDVDPQFLSSDDLRLAATSPLRGLAPLLPEVATDIDGAARPGPDQAVDPGAHEVDGPAAAATDLAVLELVSPRAGGFALPGAAFVPRARLLNPGTQTTPAASARLRIRDATDQVVFEQVQPVPALGVQATWTVQFPSATLMAGSYTITVSAELPADQTPANDLLQRPLLVRPPLAGVVTIGSAGDFPSLTNAQGLFHALGELGASAAVEARIISDLAGESGQFRIPTLSGNPELLIRPFGAPREIRGAASNALLYVNGTDNLTIDGALDGGSSADVVGGDPALRQLTIVNDAEAFAAVIQAVNLNESGANRLRLRNLIVRGRDPDLTQFGILIGAAVLGGGAVNDDVLIENCAVQRTAVGIYHFGGNAVSSRNAVIRDNDLSASGDDRIGRIGIELFSQDNALVRRNAIGGIQSVLPVDVAGIASGFGELSAQTQGAHLIVNTVLEGNRIHGLATSGPAGVYGIYFGGQNTRLVNNMISGLQGAARSNDRLAGIYLTGHAGSSMRLLHNSVHLSGERGATPAPAPSYALLVNGSDPALELRNNILSNRMTSAAPEARAYVAGFGGSSFANLGANHNLEHATGPNAGFITIGGTLGGTEVTNLAQWRTLSAGEQDSLSADPRFVSAADLHLQQAPASPALSAAAVLAEVADDIDGELRGGGGRDIGADETAPPAPGTLQLSQAVLAFGMQTVNTTSAPLETRLGAGLDGVVVVTALGSPSTPFQRDPASTCPTALPFALAAGAECSLRYRFAPLAAQSETQTLEIQTKASGSQTLSLTGSGVAAPAQLALDTGALNFPQTVLGSSSPVQFVQVRNSGGLPLTVGALTVATAPFERTADGSCAAIPFELAGGAHCSLGYRYTPTATGTQQQQLGIDAGPAGNSTLTLSGNAVAALLQLSSAELDFGTQQAGSASAERSLIIGNSGQGTLQITSFTTPNAPFERSGGDCQPAPLTLAPGAQCTLRLRFLPLKAGSFEQLLTFEDNDISNVGSVRLLGTGVARPDAVFGNGFESSGKSLQAVLDGLAAAADLLDESPLALADDIDPEGRPVQLLARRRAGRVEVIILTRDADGTWQHGNWQPVE